MLLCRIPAELRPEPTVKLPRKAGRDGVASGGWWTHHIEVVSARRAHRPYDVTQSQGTSPVGSSQAHASARHQYMS